MSHVRMIYQTDKTRERILETAQRLFVRQGLFATQMQDVAKEIGISRTSLYRYYRDKFDLATAIVNKMFHHMRAMWQEEEAERIAGLNGLARVDCFLREYWLSPRFSEELYYMAEYDAFFSGVRVTPELNLRIKQALDTDFKYPIIPFLQQGMSDGSIRPDLNPHLAAVTIVNAVRGLHQRLLLRGHALVEVEAAELPQMMDELVRHLMNGIKSPEI